MYICDINYVLLLRLPFDGSWVEVSSWNLNYIIILFYDELDCLVRFLIVMVRRQNHLGNMFIVSASANITPN